MTESAAERDLDGGPQPRPASRNLVVVYYADVSLGGWCCVMRSLGQKAFIEGVLLGLIICFSVYGAYNAFGAVERFLVKDARATATLWAEAFMLHEEVFDALLDGRQLAHREQAYLRAIATTGNVYQYKIFDAEGRLLYLSASSSLTSVEPLQAHNPEAADAALAGNTNVDVHYGDENSGAPEVYAEAYVPHLHNGAVHGVIEVSVDQTMKWRRAWTELRRILWVLVPIAMLALLHSAYTVFLLWLQRRSDAKIVHLAQHDPLTGVANRSLLSVGLSEALSGRRQADGKVALHLVDADNFKFINDTCGHHVGDLVLQEIACRISRSVRVRLETHAYRAKRRVSSRMEAA